MLRNSKLFVALYLYYFVIVAFGAEKAPRQFPVEGVVVTVDTRLRTVLVSHDAIPGYMEAMAMPFQADAKEFLAELKRGSRIRFTLCVTETSSWIANIKVVPFDSEATDPLQVRRFRALEQAMGAPSANLLHEGEQVPDFTLTDQAGNKVQLSQFIGQTVALNFIYTRCPLPEFCFRLSNNFAQLQRRFHDRLGRDLILLTISFDPAHDLPEVLAGYAQTWKADVHSWHFLTGPPAEVHRVCDLFGVSFWNDEGTMTHSLHTAIIDRTGRLVSNIEGNQYTADQLGDLLDATLPPRD